MRWQNLGTNRVLRPPSLCTSQPKQDGTQTPLRSHTRSALSAQDLDAIPPHRFVAFGAIIPGQIGANSVSGKKCIFVPPVSQQGLERLRPVSNDNCTPPAKPMQPPSFLQARLALCDPPEADGCPAIGPGEHPRFDNEIGAADQFIVRQRRGDHRCSFWSTRSGVTPACSKPCTRRRSEKPKCRESGAKAQRMKKARAPALGR
jgi:hypothetical protein